MKIARLTLLAFICIIINKADAQVGYIITQKGDTLRGDFKLSAFGRPKFKALNARDDIRVNLDTIKEYQLSDSSVYVLKRVPLSTANILLKPQILQRLEHGRINLYQYTPPAGDPIITWYASKQTDSLITIKTSDIFIGGGDSKKKRMAAFANMLADEPDVEGAFKAYGKFDFNTIRVYIKRYNQAVLSPAK